ncbi:bifunctional 2-C-methyl-D-erythritol 4-phosphate cytidylyltransferase/2-C-methyl-D-erythritol 2,4-cyclodiphosphate synthase [Roseinatronobacter bogoriensis]|uniref:Bifunctional enzyme IspD/IspF n=1 Tax=Roseinatronobacter bogoriensis subsp. barguzinensis TaxID=441209 RepID=A0A2K8KB50_9RHOB|nr:MULTISPECIES: bifunctional 2-C-methyl-D-erythritol 4-phosphate cytidylyltransferase/2-C-methyl-D-erythritol 2,4-cyclodiphosphate synthase [Rhodobaca]ATX66657.1 bifunctional 2-C-methyl-D-erythritol 4-phosphate cytidylyltransferase/2-C-methyl-D-erythritol 2,4-cyclodiphosphate synthase [Rhodobaca barguzinensis]MBB4207837.1 2-C-methyl-D-erythritol 4-phosphate cytidylyltransferase/2-C-methyl-D-erythritol 2,4-cyclodiphosphate synthase [Rhodobaca bogoriensis DSM 18756]TDW39857.1 2-C-methyl-D-erythri
MHHNIAALIVAAGRGTRAGGDLPKQWRELAGRSVLEHTLDAFRRAGIKRIILVIHPDDREKANRLVAPDVTLVNGGDTRVTSVRAALESLVTDAPQHVLIHDGARPLVSASVINDVRDALRHAEGAAPALPVVDALWRGTDGHVAAAVPRAGLFRAQTPQGFGFSFILQAHRAYEGEAADDVEIARAAGMEIVMTPGCEDNIKLTYQADFDRAERLITHRQERDMDIRLGNGYDVHRFGPGDGCWLCGIKVPHNRALQGHSDADVGMHALTDAIYGALAEGDIGRHFPPSDPQWKGADSRIFLRHAVELMRERGFRLNNCDVTLVCEHPKIGPHARAMQAELAEIMGCEVHRVSVKATTSERLGFTGREEGIAAIATACLGRNAGDT